MAAPSFGKGASRAEVKVFSDVGLFKVSPLSYQVPCSVDVLQIFWWSELPLRFQEVSFFCGSGLLARRA